MADIAQRDVAADARPPTSARAKPSHEAARRDRRNQPPRTDVGTILLHWTTAIAFIVSLFTGIRIAADAYLAPVSHWLVPILPQGEIWTWHFVAGLTLFFSASAYLIYMHRSGLSPRNALKKLRVLLMPAARKMKFEALNVGLHWFVYALVVVMTVTGILLYLGHGGWLVWVHSTTAFIGLGYIFVHVLAHYLQGGWWQIFRVFRPARLVPTRATRARPLLIAAAVGAATVAIAAGIDWSTRDALTIARVSGAPTLDGVLDDPIWNRASPVTIRTQQGNALRGGESTVEVRAVHNGSKVYFAFRWEDPTRSMRRIPMIKRADGWHLLHDHADIADVNTFYEDKLAVGLSRSPAFGNADSTHLGTKPLTDKPAPLHGRGYHYVATDDDLVDVWQWKASRGGHLGYVDDQYFGAPRDATPAEASGRARYQAGYWNDPGRAFYSYNYAGEPPGGFRGPVKIQKLPKDWRATVAALGRFDLDPNSNDEEGSRWWMTEDEVVPYSAEVDAQIPVGTIIPGVLVAGSYEGDRADVQGTAMWKDGHWHLEMVRNLRTGSKYDHDFVPGRDLYMWVNVFDHTQTRHSRHVRPVRIVTQP